jgi:hypothetical protein
VTDPKNVGIAIGGIAAALIVLFIGVGVILGVGHEVPTPLWSAASALSGALVGILVPPPSKAVYQKKQLKGHLAELTALKNKQEPNLDRLRTASAIADSASRIAPYKNDLVAAAQNLTVIANQVANNDTSATETVQTAAIADAHAATESATKDVNSASFDVRALGLLLFALVAFACAGVLTYQVGGHLSADTLYNALVAKHPKGSAAYLEKAATMATVHDGSLKSAAAALIALGSAAGGALVGLLAPSPTAQPDPAAS